MSMKSRAQMVGAPLVAFAVALSVMTYVPFALASGGNDSGVAGHISSFTATPSTITLGQSSTLTWNATDISRCIVRGPGGVVVYDQFADSSHALSGPAVVTPQAPAPYTYIVNCYDFATGTIIQKNLVVTVNAP